MSIVKDQNLAPTDHRKINWVRNFMPTLDGIKARFEQEQPFTDLRVAVSAHLETKTTNLGYVLIKGRAGVRLTGPNPLSTQDDMTVGLADMGVETFSIHGAMGEGYEDLLIEALKLKPHLTVGDGGDLIHLLGGKCADLGEHLIGGCEETTTGILHLKTREREGILPYSMMAVNDARTKHYCDNKYGTGQSAWDAIMHTASLVVTSKTMMVTGYGWYGKGVAMRAASMGVSVIVTEAGPFKALGATMSGFRVMLVGGAIRYSDTFVTVTGYRDVVTPKHFAVVKHNVIPTNAGHLNCEVGVADLAAMAVKRELCQDNIKDSTLPDGRVLSVIGEGWLVNPAADNDHPAETMDMSFSVQTLTLEWLIKCRDGLEKKAYQVPAEVDDATGWIKLAAMGLSIDALTLEQEECLNGWKA